MLRSVAFCLPSAHASFGLELLQALGFAGDIKDDTIRIRASKESYRPQLKVRLDSVDAVTVRFDLDDGQEDVAIKNDTGMDRSSPETYQPIALKEYRRRIAALRPERLDHLGFNLPWFDGLHPRIAELRQRLAPVTAYYRFPEGQDWDFILPATADEIVSGAIDLSVERRPKLEIVSFDKSSVPILQIDFMVGAGYDTIVAAFPEGIRDGGLQNVWVYVDNPYGLDICFVINAHHDGDWSGFFDGKRL